MNHQYSKITALYSRLSVGDEDRDGGESNSIQNQKKRLEDYARQNGFANPRHYTDDGFSGGNFERPDWKRLIADIEAGKVGCVIACDMSRVGRDYLQTGFYTEVLFRHRGGRKKYPDKGPDPATGLYPADSYDCSTYTLTFQNMTNKCFSHHISTKALRALILETIRMVSRYAISNEAEFTKRVREASQLRQAEAAKDRKRKLNRDRKRSAELDGLIKKLYEAFATGKLTEKRFELLSAEYEREQAEPDAAIKTAQVELDAFNEDTARAEQFLALAKKYTDFTELTTPMLHEFIEKILVHASDRSSEERVQEVEIHLKFIGRFDVPMPEPTPEELAEEEPRRKRREANHRKYLRKKERERQKKLAAGQEAET